MLTLESVSQAKISSETSTSSVVLEGLTPEIQGSFGPFRQAVIGGNTYNIDSRKVVNAGFYKKGCNATITLIEGKKKDGTEGTFINSLVVELPAGVMSSQR